MRNARKDTRRRSVNAGLLAGLFALLIALVAAGCGSSSSSSSKIDVVGYSTQTVYEESLEPGLREDLGGLRRQLHRLLRRLR